MYRRIDPPPSLREQHGRRVWRDRLGMRIPYKLGLVRREVLEHKGSEVPVFSEMKQVLQVKRVDPILRVVVDDLVGDEEGFMAVGRTKAVHGETTRKAGDGPEE